MKAHKNPDYLKSFEDNWRTKMGAWFPGERVVYRGKDMATELSEMPWMGLLLYGITGREFSKEQIKLFEAFWVISASYPDPRLWNNRVAALAGTTRSTMSLALGSANAVSEATAYGRRPDIRSIDFLFRTKKKLDSGTPLEGIVRAELKKYRNITGYGRPIVRNDERIKPMMNLAERLGMGNGDYVKLAFDMEKILFEGRWRWQMNIAMLLAALAADQGLSSDEYYQYTALSFTAGMVPCYIDALGAESATFFPLNTERVCYAGLEKRKW